MSADVNKERTERSIQYALWRINLLKLEFELLMIEHKGLVDTAKTLVDYKQANIAPLLDTDLRYDDVFWKWSEQSSRYYEQGAAVHKILLEKAEQIKGLFIALKADYAELGTEIEIDFDIDREIETLNDFIN